MAETLISPGVLARENDQSFITSQPVQAGAAIIGPTVRGKVGIPTLVTSYSEYKNIFGSTFESGSETYSYFTSISAYNYFQNGGTSLLVTRVVSGSFTPATSTTIPTAIAATDASASFDVSPFHPSGSFTLNDITIAITGSPAPTNTSTTIFVSSGSSAANSAFSASVAITVSASVAPYSASIQYISASSAGTTLNLTYIGPNGLTGNSQTFTSGSTTTNFSGGSNTEAFSLETLTEGVIMNNDDAQYTDGSLPSGSVDNIRWEITSNDTDEGTFALLIRRGDDDRNFPVILETWNNLSLDPKQPNYIEKVIGNQTETVQQDGNDYYVENIGTYENKSKYVRVASVSYKTPDYLDNSGTFKPQYTASIPVNVSGNFSGATGDNIPSTEGNYYDNIDNSNTQGLQASDYDTSIALLNNKDNYQYNFITIPGLVQDGTNFASHSSTVTTLLSNCESRGDTMLIVDVAGYSSTVSSVTSNAVGINSSYAATYWPWVKTIDPDTGQRVWVPASVLMPGVYSFNDQVAAPWFAPAGTNRGVISNAISAERTLPQSTRDTLYKSNVNPLATFPGTGVTVFGQKTLQKKKSALDRVNVRRLLIELKSFITQIADTLVFEQNTVATRNEFLNQVNPYLSSVQQREGLTSFRVVMDETNNTPTTIDNNELIGQIYLQPTKTVEFILLDFNVTSTGVTFE